MGGTVSKKSTIGISAMALLLGIGAAIPVLKFLGVASPGEVKSVQVEHSKRIMAVELHLQQLPTKEQLQELGTQLTIAVTRIEELNKRLDRMEVP